MGKIRCTDCEWFGEAEAALSAQNPFDVTEIIYGCPVCKAIEQFMLVCDEPGCKRDVSCGTPTPEGYRHTCGTHAPRTVPPTVDQR